MGVVEVKSYLSGYFKSIVGAIILLVILYMYQSFDRAYNYVKSEAVIDDIIVDCYIKSNGKKLTNKDTGEFLFSPCEHAKKLATANGLLPEDVHERHNIYYSYESPVDDSPQKGKEEDVGAYIVKHYSIGKKISIYASLNDPKISKMDKLDW